MAEWIEIIVPTSVSALEDVASAVSADIEEAAAGTELRSDEVVFWVPLADGESVLSRTQSAAAVWAKAGLPVVPEDIRLQSAAPEEEWRNAWKKYFHVTRLTRQIVVVPSWESYSATADDVVMHLDPGQAFGTGSHASTQLVLEELQELADQGRQFDRLCDVGTGSGILSIAACRLWPTLTAVAVDVDPLAVSATRENCAANDLAGRVMVDTTPAGSIEGTFSLVVANIQAHILLAIRDDLIALLSPGAPLLLSGILTSQVDHVASQFVARGLVLDRKRPSSIDREWTGATLHRPASR